MVGPIGLWRLRHNTEKFLLSAANKPDADHELALLRGLLTPGVTWPDVACGIDYFLRHFLEVERAGIDLWPAMLRLARGANPGVPLIEGDFRDRNASAPNRWGLVSCMWYACGLIDTVTDLLRLIENMAAWTAPGGIASFAICTFRWRRVDRAALCHDRKSRN
jgi:SAM-dependent methyltransferase